MVSNVIEAEQELKEFNGKLNLLYKVGRTVGSASEVSKVVDQILRMTRRALGAKASSVLLIDDEGGELQFKVAQGRASKELEQMKLPANSGIAGWVASHGRPLVINDVTKDSRFYSGVDRSTGFVTRSILAVPLMIEGSVIGVLEVLNKVDENGFSERDLEVVVALASTAAIAIDNVKLHQELLNEHKSTLKALAAAIETKDPYTCGHSQRVTEYALLGGGSLQLPKEELEVIEYAGILHDIGKIGVPDRILSKPGSLTEKEWGIIRQHPEMGAKIIDGIPFLEEAKKLVLHHHERYDGNGYPRGIKGGNIPLGARLLSVADAFDTMTTKRSYRISISAKDAIRELHRCATTQFCPNAVEAFTSGLKKRAELIPPEFQTLLINGHGCLV